MFEMLLCNNNVANVCFMAELTLAFLQRLLRWTATTFFITLVRFYQLTTASPFLLELHQARVMLHNSTFHFPLLTHSEPLRWLKLTSLLIVRKEQSEL